MEDNKYQDILNLIKKIEANSNLKAYASDVFYISDPELTKEITKKGKEAVKKYKELFCDSDECYVTKDALDKFNEMLHDGEHTFEQTYGCMILEKNKQDHEFYLKTGMHLCNDYAFLYPESICSYGKM